MRKSLRISLIAVFGALHATLYFLSFDLGPWRNWAIYLEAIEGIILGPQAGFLAALLGSSVARMIRFDSLWIFGIIAETVSVLTAGFLARGKWKPSMVVYSVMLLAYFLHPYGRMLPLWTILDILLAFILIYPAAKLSNGLHGTSLNRLSISLVLIGFVCIATDSLVRIFLLVPGGLYNVFSDFATFQSLQYIFTVSAAYSYIEDVVVVAVSLLVGVPLMVVLSKLQFFQEKKQKDETKPIPPA
ncbi:MAG TPA: hypothetical protein VMW36_03605 [Patescibacteria group bacterium]|nr:hypothetical protein [Patescibacteria group bacterium]